MLQDAIPSTCGVAEHAELVPNLCKNLSNVGMCRCKLPSELLAGVGTLTVGEGMHILYCAEYVEVAEQCLKCLELVAQRGYATILRANGLVAVRLSITPNHQPRPSTPS